MWRKIILVMFAALILLAASSPVLAYDPRCRLPFGEPSNDEHPWGDENYSNERPLIGYDRVYTLTGNYDLISIAVQGVWDSAVGKAKEIFGLQNSQARTATVSETRTMRIYNSRKPSAMRKR
ncbi:MAG: hypothetical protein ABIE07_02325 [Candidatus Zixiibacteriota bacterium]